MRPMKTTTKIVAGIAVIAATTSAWTLAHRGSRSAARPSASTLAATPIPGVSAPTTTSVGEPASTGSAMRTEIGARRAAVDFLKLDEQLFPATSPEKARALTESIASAAERVRLGDEAELHQRQRLAEGSTNGLVLRIAPITARTVSYGDSAATVDVFFVRLWSFPGTGALDDYATVEVHLLWERDSWRLDSSSLVDGPTPVDRYGQRTPTPSEAARFEQRLEGFTDEGIVP